MVKEEGMALVNGIVGQAVLERLQSFMVHLPKYQKRKDPKQDWCGVKDKLHMTLGSCVFLVSK